VLWPTSLLPHMTGLHNHGCDAQLLADTLPRLFAHAEEDTHQLSSFASQLAEDFAFDTLYTCQFPATLFSKEADHLKSPTPAGGSEDKTCLMIAASLGLEAATESLLEVLDSDPRLNAADRMGMTALHMAAKHGHTKVPRELIGMLRCRLTSARPSRASTACSCRQVPLTASDVSKFSLPLSDPLLSILSVSVSDRQNAAKWRSAAQLAVQQPAAP
jgi:hypothetical protein